MPSMRFNPGRKSGNTAPQRRKYQSQPRPRRKSPNAWSMKLGAWAHARVRDIRYDSLSRRVTLYSALAAIGIIFILILSALGVFTRIGNGVAAIGAGATRTIGLSVSSVDVVPSKGRVLTSIQAEEVRAIAGVPQDEIMFQTNPAQIREKIMVLPWVESVTVRRLWPSNIEVIITPREASALWQENGTLQYIDATGKKLGPADPEKAKKLPLIIGRNAGSAAPAMFASLEKYPKISAHIHALVRVDDRRWNLKLINGSDVLLPADNYEAILGKLENLEIQYGLLGRDFARLDARIPGQLIIRPRAEAPLTSSNA